MSEPTDAERLDWLENQGGGTLAQVAGNIMPAFTWVFIPNDCEGLEDEVDMGRGIRGAIDQAMKRTRPRPRKDKPFKYDELETEVLDIRNVRPILLTEPETRKDGE